jgi:hypothetical protein
MENMYPKGVIRKNKRCKVIENRADSYGEAGSMTLKGKSYVVEWGSKRGKHITKSRYIL